MWTTRFPWLGGGMVAGMSDEKRREGSQEPAEEPLREEDVTSADRLDDRVSEAEGLPEPLDPVPPARRERG